MNYRIRLLMGVIQLCMVFSYSSLRGNPVSEFEFSQIRDSSFISNGLAWVLLENDSLLFTRNGGKKWHKLLHTPKRIKKIVFVNDKVGWGVTFDGRIYQTKNGGDNWINISNLDKNWLEDTSPAQISFSNSQEGWILAAPFYLFKTVDGGLNWKKVNLPKDIEVGRFQLLNNNQVWVACMYGSIIHTSDSGESWETYKIKQSIGWVVDVFFIDKDTGWVTGNPDFGVYKTTDNGLSWQQRFVSERIYKNFTINSLYFTNQKEGWIVGQDKWKRTIEHFGIVLHTIDGGLNWQKIPIKGNDTVFRKVYFTNQQEGWLVDFDHIYRTTDKGKTWRRVLSVPPFKESGSDVFLK